MVAGETLWHMIERHEGRRLLPYLDTKGIWTVGVGHNLTQPLSDAAVTQILQDDILQATKDCTAAFPWFGILSSPRQWALIDMCFNLGLRRLLGFQKMLRALSVGDYATAAHEMRNSLWATEVGGRALELAAMIEGTAEV